MDFLLSIVIPFHRISDELRANLEQIFNSQFKNLIGEIVLAHNGPHLADFNRASEIAKDFKRVSVIHTDIPGLGAGCQIGIERAQCPYILITAIDFPFRFSDLKEWFSLYQQSQLKDIVIGSKLHPKTFISNRGVLRKLATSVFLTLKKLIIPIRLPLDTQGTIFIKTNIAKIAKKHCESTGFFYTTELVAIAINQGASFTEVPVHYPANESKSSVSPIKEGFIFIKSLIKLRKKLTEITYDKK